MSSKLSETREYLRRRLKLFRETSGVTPEEISEIVGKKPKTVVGWEYGIGSPSLEELAVLCEMYGVTPSDLFPGFGKPDSTADEARMLATFRSLGEREKSAVLEMATLLAGK